MPGETKIKINPDIDNERKKCTFDVEELARWWHSGEKKLKEKRKLDDYILNDPELVDKIPMPYLSHKEVLDDSIRKAVYVLKKLKNYQPDDTTNNNDPMQKLINHFFVLSNLGSSGVLREGYTFTTHCSMFVPSILRLGTEEQQAKWFEKALNLNIIGTYAQTELAHGTFVRGIATTATYVEKTQEFILNSPTLSSYKWWPGGMGRNANYAILVAQLYTKGIHRGIQLFVVQIRDENTWAPMPGIEVGEIGATLGVRNFNNGYLGLKNVRIPRTNMLMRNAQVLEDGTFVESSSAVLSYNIMMYVRGSVIKFLASNLCKATTIATRYSAVRRQSPIDPNHPEPQIIDHVAQQYKVFPNIAKCFVFKIAGDIAWDTYLQMNAETDEGNFERLNEVHNMLCFLKAVCAAEVSAGIETLRMACGGHGYMASSNFPMIYAQATAACTYEGEYTILMLQSARYLVKCWKLMKSNAALPPSVEYLRNISTNNSHKWDPSLIGIISALQIVAAHKVRIATENVEKRIKMGNTLGQANNMTSIELVHAAEANAKVFLVTLAFGITKGIGEAVPTSLATVVHQLIELYIVDTCLKSLSDILRFINVTEQDIQDLQLRLENLLCKIRPNAVGIVDGFDFHDVILCSTLGSYDGNVYERLYEDAQKSPLNQEDDNKSFHLYLKPFMQSNL